MPWGSAIGTYIMAKKSNAVTVVNQIDLVSWSDTKVNLPVLWAVASPASNGMPRLLGSIQLTDETMEALELLNHGNPPAIEFNEKGNEIPPSIPACPQSGLPLWKYRKASKKLGTESELFPIQSAFNRRTDDGQVTTVRQSIQVKGFDTKVSRIVVAVRGGKAWFCDGGHRVTTLCQMFRDGIDLSNNIVDIQVIYIDGFDRDEEGNEINPLAGFDELQRFRSIKDVLQASGLASTWESEVQHVISGLFLLCSGKGLGGSGKTIPHEVDSESGKPRKLSESELAAYYNKSIPPFDKIRDSINVLVETCSVIDEEGNDTEIQLCDMPTVKRYPYGAWMLSLIEVSVALKCTVRSLGEKLRQSIESGDKYASKLDSWASTKGKGTIEDTFPILCCVLTALESESDLPSRKPTSRASIHCRIAYDAWRDKQATE